MGHPLKVNLIDVSLDSFELSDSAKAHSDEISSYLSKASDKIENVIKEVSTGDIKHMPKLPLQSVFPAIGVYFGSMFAENTIFSNEHIEFGVSPKMVPNLLTEK